MHRRPTKKLQKHVFNEFEKTHQIWNKVNKRNNQDREKEHSKNTWFKDSPAAKQSEQIDGKSHWEGIICWITALHQDLKENIYFLWFLWFPYLFSLFMKVDDAKWLDKDLIEKIPEASRDQQQGSSTITNNWYALSNNNIIYLVRSLQYKNLPKSSPYCFPLFWTSTFSVEKSLILVILSKSSSNPPTLQALEHRTSSHYQL